MNIYEARQEDLGPDIVKVFKAKDTDDASDKVFDLTRGGFFNKNSQVTIYDVTHPDAGAIEVAGVMHMSNS